MRSRFFNGVLRSLYWAQERAGITAAPDANNASTDNQLVQTMRNLGGPVGEIIMFAGGDLTNIPEGFLLCDGALVPQSTHARLYAVIGNTYGNVGTKFKLPNLVDKFVYGTATSNLAMSNRTGGAATDRIDINAHTHTTPASKTGSTTLQPNQQGTFDWRVRGVIHGGGTGAVTTYNVEIDGDVHTGSSTKWTSYSTASLSAAAAGHYHNIPARTTTSAGASSHTVDTVPPYLRLAYLIRYL